VTELRQRVTSTGSGGRSRATVEIRHVTGASDASYVVGAFGDELLMQLQLSVHRLVVV
jgi:hypothetical protein